MNVRLLCDIEVPPSIQFYIFTIPGAAVRLDPQWMSLTLGSNSSRQQAPEKHRDSPFARGGRDLVRIPAAGMKKMSHFEQDASFSRAN